MGLSLPLGAGAARTARVGGTLGGERRRRRRQVAAQACKRLDHSIRPHQSSPCTRAGCCCGLDASAIAVAPPVACTARPVALVTALDEDSRRSFPVLRARARRRGALSEQCSKGRRWWSSRGACMGLRVQERAQRDLFVGCRRSPAGAAGGHPSPPELQTQHRWGSYRAASAHVRQFHPVVNSTASCSVSSSRSSSLPGGPSRPSPTSSPSAVFSGRFTCAGKQFGSAQQTSRRAGWEERRQVYVDVVHRLHV